MVKDDCIFCKIAAGQIPSETVYEDEMFRAILDLGPATKGHTLILPKDHFNDVTEITESCSAKILPLAAKIGNAMKKGLGCDGFNLVQNNGEAAGQTVMHLHIHVIPRYKDEKEAIAVWTQHEVKKEELASTGEKIRNAMS